MSTRGEHPLPDDLLSVAERLRQDRPSPDGLTLDRIKTRACRQSTAKHRRGALLKSRLAITMVLALGILMSLSGAGLAVSGLADSGDSGTTQYSSDDDSSETFGGDTSEAGTDAEEVDATSVDPVAQESAGEGDGELAFTGFVAIPVLIGGVALLGSGFVLRRRAGREEG